MSILMVSATSFALAVADPNAPPEEVSLRTLLFVLGLTVVSVATAIMAGVFRTGSVDGPARLRRDQPVFPILAIAAGAMVLWQGIVPMLYFGIRQAQVAASQSPGKRFDVSMLTSSDYAWLSTVPFIIGFLGLWLGDLILDVVNTGRSRLFGTVSGLGLRLRNLPAGLAKGLLGSLIAMPLMFWLLIGIDIGYRWIGFEHPKEHDLLRMMTESPSVAIKWAFIFGAVIASPFFEEYLFRGHVQTAIREALLRRSRSPQPQSQPMADVATPDVQIALTYEPQTDEDLSQTREGGWQAWAAIVLTSLAFTAVHMQLWMFPPIFALSLALGYAYERTGNLWTSVVMHAVFNAGSTAIYLSQGGAG